METSNELHIHFYTNCARTLLVRCRNLCLINNDIEITNGKLFSLKKIIKTMRTSLTITSIERSFDLVRFKEICFGLKNASFIGKKNKEQFHALS